jgi:hypothetical protein
MKIKYLWRIYVIVISLAIIAALCATTVFLRSASADHNTLDNLITFVVTILSMLVAILAYHVSVKTYISIDSVNAISRMDGNVMENENYRTGIISIIRHFNETDSINACNQLIGHLEQLFKTNSINSGARLADNIQEMIDVIVLLSFIVKRKNKETDEQDQYNNQIIARIESLMNKIENKVATFEQLSEGSCILIRESVKLLKAVYAYQCYKSGTTNNENVALLMDVRGAMLKNAISRTIYYNYMGLMYMSKATECINKYFKSLNKKNYDILSIEVVPLLKEMQKSSEKDLAIIYLKEAILNFNQAVQTIKDELMWNAFIQYNKARAQYILSLLLQSNDKTWETTMKTAIDYRLKLVMILNDILDENQKTYFQRAFSDQLKLAQLMLIRLQIASNMPFEYNKSIDIGCDEFSRLKHIKNDIETYLKRQTITE